MKGPSSVAEATERQSSPQEWKIQRKLQFREKTGQFRRGKRGSVLPLCGQKYGEGEGGETEERRREAEEEKKAEKGEWGSA